MGFNSGFKGLIHKLLVSYADQNVITYNIGDTINANTIYYMLLL